MEISMEVSLLPPTSMEANLLPWMLVETSMEDRAEVGGPLWKSCGGSWKFVMLVEVGRRYVGVYGSSWKLLRNIFVEAAVDECNGSFHFH